MSDKYYGLYRAICTDNNDPAGTNKIRVQIPSIVGTTDDSGDLFQTGWIPGCLPAVDNGTHLNHTDGYTTTSTSVGPYGSHTHHVTLNAEHSSHLTVPNVGQPVWIMFEQGDVNFPVWMGVYL